MEQGESKGRAGSQNFWLCLEAWAPGAVGRALALESKVNSAHDCLVFSV